ncbi:metallopeptidase family protein [Desulfofustis limnaeus]|jgi:predicted Zn-dependent protease with MMP-like domain|uniref:Metallopeptidase family protein n=1 Tax=Desulfofustis limnaeus TaxID=2740163 RepID=A0ABM7W5I5_9BACT|nr:metallopeptidase family protein [Desulfofustis limnaeus]MDX9895443.1 metallopeptidase family protein [Desulfofustis sp.]BDD86205.1 hypothetical protein DPPLL_05700 [Desulfofustis limnaeus]
MDRDTFSQLTEQVFDALPDLLLAKVDNVVFVVEEWPDEETLAAMGIDSRLDLLGLYQGVPLDERSHDLSGSLPDQIFLYQRPIEYWAEVDDLPVYDVIYDTLVHEIGHHFGFDEDQLTALENGDGDSDDW